MNHQALMTNLNVTNKLPENIRNTRVQVSTLGNCERPESVPGGGATSQKVDEWAPIVQLRPRVLEVEVLETREIDLVLVRVWFWEHVG